MSEGEKQEPYSFIQTPLEFFGHSKDAIYFGYPDLYYQEIEEAQMQTREALAELEAEHQQALEKKKQNPDQYVQFASDKEYEEYRDYTEHLHTRNVKHDWYGRRFRGRYAGLAKERHAQANSYFEWEYLGQAGPPPPLPPPESISAYLNDQITCNEWASAYSVARRWFDALPENDPVRETAANYAGFTGNIILHEYCRIALALADDSLADDDFVSVKHFFTICLPYAKQLERFIPDEVKHAKQVLREVFMQYSIRSGNIVERYSELFGRIVLDHDLTGDLDKRDENEREALVAIMRYEDTENIDKQTMQTRLLELANHLEAQQKWTQAIDMLDLGCYAFDLPREIIQARIDELAINAVLHFTADMSKLDERWTYTIGKHEYWTDNGEQMNAIQFSSGVSWETKAKLTEIEDLRGLEYRTHLLTQADEQSRKKVIWELFEKLSVTSGEITTRFASPEIVDGFIEQLSSPSVLKLSGSAIDKVVEKIITLRNKGVFTAEQQNDLLATIADNLASKPYESAGEDYFEQFIGFISPILRATNATELPDDEVVWKFISKQQFASIIATVLSNTNKEKYPDAYEWLLSREEAFSKDIRGSWSAYWKEFGEYA